MNLKKILVLTLTLTHSVEHNFMAIVLIHVNWSLTVQGVQTGRLYRWAVQPV